MVPYNFFRFHWIKKENHDCKTEGFGVWYTTNDTAETDAIVNMVEKELPKTPVSEICIQNVYPITVNDYEAFTGQPFHLR